MRVSEILKEACIVQNIKGKRKEEVIVELIEHLYKKNLIPDKKEAEKVVFERERLGSTGIGEGIAIPHGKLKNIENLTCALGVAKEGVEFDAVDGKPVYLIFLLFAPEHMASLHLEALSKISRMLKNGLLVQRILKAKDPEEIYFLICESELEQR